MQRLLPVGTAMIALLIYWRTLLPGVGIWDTAEFQTVPWLLGIMHATGYPLYTLLGKLATLLLPFGSVAYRLNLFSALCAAIAAGLLVPVARRLGAGWGPACGAGLAFAFCVPTWETALRADPHTLHAALVTGLLWLLLRWREAPSPRRLGALTLGVGLALSNHMQTTMLLPGLAVGALWHRLNALPRALPLGIGGLLLGLSTYLYLPLRARQHPPLNYGRPEDWEHFRALVLGEGFRQDMGALTFKGLETFAVQLGKLPDVYALWWAPWVLPAVALAAIGGLVALARRDGGAATALVLVLFLPLYWACTWINGDAARYFIVPTMILVLLAALGLEAGLAAVKPRWLALCLAIACAVAPLALVPRHFFALDRSQDRSGEVYAHSTLERLPPNAAIFTVWVNATPLWYAHHVEGLRPDVRIIDDSEVVLDHQGDLKRAIAAQLRQRPVFVLHPGNDAELVRASFKTRTLDTIQPFAYPLVEVTSP
jgi:hypothetical protein